jgi:signal transduction histidine kinase
MVTQSDNRVIGTLRRYTGPYAFAWQVGLMVLVPLSVGTALADVARTSDDWWPWIVVGACSFFVAMGAFLLFGLLLRAVPQGWVRAILVLFAYGTIEAGRAVVVHGLAVWEGLAVDDLVVFRLAAGFATGLALFALASIVVNDGKLYRAEMQILQRQDGRLRNLLARTVAERAAVRAELLRGIRETVDEAIRAVLRPHRKHASAQEVVDTLIGLSDGVIRPLSHDLHENPRSFPEAPAPVLRTRVRVRDVLSFATLARPYRPLVTCVFALLLASPPLFFTLGPWLGALASAVLAVAIFAFLGLGWFDARRRYARIHLATRVVLMTLNFLTLGTALSLAFTLLRVWESGFTWSNLIYTTVLGPLVCWLVVLPAGINAARQQILRDSERVNKQLRWELARANALVWQEQQELSTALHRDIQGTLLASAFRLKQVIENGGDTGAAIDEIRTILDDSVTLLQSSGGPETLHRVISELVDRWTGVLDIRSTYSGSTRAVIEKDRVVMRAIRDMASEFATNSVKHGRAHTMTVTLALPSDHEVELTLTNDGDTIDDDFSPGLGTILIENLATSVSYAPVDTGVSLTITLPTGITSERQTTTPLVPVPSVE